MKKLQIITIGLLLSVSIMARPLTHLEREKVQKNHNITTVIAVSSAAAIGFSTGLVVPSTIIMTVKLIDAIRVKRKLR